MHREESKVRLSCGHSNAFTTLLNEGFHFAETGESHISFDGYLQNLDESFEDALRRMQVVQIESVAASAIELRKTPDLIFRASVRETAEGSARVYVSRGVYLALTDLAIRATCSELFFNPWHTDVEYSERWRNACCMKFPIVLPPRHRYYDYTPAPELISDDARRWLEWWRGHKSATVGPPSWIGRVVQRMPLDDERLGVSAWLMDVGLWWIVMHERSHHAQGHLRHWRDAPQSAELCRAFEWQADRDATLAIYQIFFSNRPIALPDYASRDWLWLLRFLMTAIGLAMLAIDRSRQINGVRANSPPPRIRILSAIATLSMHVEDRSSDLRQMRDLRHGEPGELFDHVRRIRALIGTLHDLTEILRLTAQEESHPDPDPLWPLEDYAPFIMGPTLHWMSIVKLEEPGFRERIDADVDAMARKIVTCWGKPAFEAERILAMARRWAAEVKEFILANSRRMKGL